MKGAAGQRVANVSDDCGALMQGLYKRAWYPVGFFGIATSAVGCISIATFLIRATGIGFPPRSDSGR